MKRIIAAIVLTVMLNSSILLSTFANDDSLSSYNTELREIYNTDSIEINPTTKIMVDGKEEVLELNYKYLTRQQKELDYWGYLNTALDGNYIVYGSEFGDYRSRPKYLTYDISKRNKPEIRYLGYSVDGSKFDNPAFPWNNAPDKGIIDWGIIKEPWKDKITREKFNLNKEGSDYNNLFINGVSSYNIEKNIEYGLFAKYVILTDGDTVVNGKGGVLLYYGDTYMNLIEDERFITVSLGGITNRAEVLKPDAVKKSKNGWLDFVYVLSLPTRTSWGTGWLFYDNGNGSSYITVLLAPDELVEMGESNEGNEDNNTEVQKSQVNINGDIELSERYITKAFSLSNIGGVQTFNFDYESAGKHKHYSKDDEGDISYYDRDIPLDQLYKYVIENKTSINSNAVGNAGRFIPKYNETNVKSGTASWGGGNSSLRPNMFLTAFRGNDLPTIASYKEGNKHPLMELGLKAGKTPQSSRNATGGYIDDINFRLEKSNNDNADYLTSFTDGDSSKTQTHDTGDIANYNAALAVKSYIGKENKAAETSDYTIKSFSIGNIKFNKSKGYPIINTNPIKFYPYIEMSYELPATGADGSGVLSDRVNVLAAHESSVKANDWVDIGWYNDISNSLTLNSTQ